MQTAMIGDLVCSTPVFREIKKKYGHAHLAVMVTPVTKALLEHNPHVDELISVEIAECRGLLGKFKLSRSIRKGQYDLAICLNPNVLSAFVASWGLVPVRLSIMPNFSGITFRLASFLFTSLELHSGGRLITETYMRMLRRIGIETDDLSKEVYKSPDADKKVSDVLSGMSRPVIGIAIGSGNKLKELEPAKTVRLADALLEKLDSTVILIGSAEDKSAAYRILESAHEKDRIINLAGCFDLQELPALLERLALFIGVDTGLTYMANALSIPIIHLAGPVDISELRPVGENVVSLQEKLPCVPCTYAFRTPYVCKCGNRKCIAMINIERIVDIAKELINKEMRFSG